MLIADCRIRDLLLLCRLAARDGSAFARFAHYSASVALLRRSFSPLHYLLTFYSLVSSVLRCAFTAGRSRRRRNGATAGKPYIARREVQVGTDAAARAIDARFLRVAAYADAAAVIAKSSSALRGTRYCQPHLQRAVRYYCA